MKKRTAFRIIIYSILGSLLVFLFFVKINLERFQKMVADESWIIAKPVTVFSCDEQEQLSRTLHWLSQDFTPPPATAFNYYTTGEIPEYTDQAISILENFAKSIPGEAEDIDRIFEKRNTFLTSPEDDNPLTECRVMVKNMAAYAAHCFNNKEYEKGLEFLRKATIVSLAVTYGWDGYMPLISPMIGIACLRISLLPAHDLLVQDKNKPPEWVKESILNTLKQAEKYCVTWRECLEGEEETGIAFFELFQKEFPVSMFFLDNILVRKYNTVTKYKEIFHTFKTMENNNTTNKEIAQYMDKVFTDIEKNFLLRMSLPFVTKARLKFKEYKTMNSILCSALSGKELSDPFSGKKLIRKNSGNSVTIYSIGPDQKDDGGKGNFRSEYREQGDISLTSPWI